MSLNFKEINGILSEIKLEGSHIQKIRQPDFHSLYMEMYGPGGRYGLYIGLAPGATRIHLCPRAPSSEIKLQRFAQFLRARFTGGRIVSAEHWNNDRIIRLGIRRAGEELVLWIRLWSGAANIIAAAADGEVLDAFYRRPKRNEVSGGLFAPPEPRPMSEDKAAAISDRFSAAAAGESGSYNKAVHDFYGNEEKRELTGRLRQKVMKALDTGESRARASLKRLENKAGEYGGYEEYKQAGDLLMSNLHQLAPGAGWARVENYYRDNSISEIEMDPALSPEKNAENYYAKYRKARSGIEKVQEEILNQKLVLEQIEEDRIRFSECEDPAELSDFLEAIPKQTKKDSRDSLPGLQFRSGDYVVLVGRTAAENDHLLRKVVRGNDIWLHTRDYPGAYVFIRTTKGKSVPLETLLDAGNLAVLYSKAKNSGGAELYYTQVKYLRRAKDGKTGLVLPTQEKNLSIRLDNARLDRLRKKDE